MITRNTSKTIQFKFYCMTSIVHAIAKFKGKSKLIAVFSEAVHAVLELMVKAAAKKSLW